MLEELSIAMVTIMSDDKEQNDECKLAPTDSEGNPNLCCCYILNADGQIEDPCYLPVEECCRHD